MCGWKDGCRFAEKEEHVRATLENGREMLIRVSVGSEQKSKNLSTVRSAFSQIACFM